MDKKTRLWGRKPDLVLFEFGMKVGEDSAMSWVNQETKYCGEVISDDVQLWTGDMSEPNVTGEKHDKNLKT